jgi:hypothetical protein
MDNMTKTTSKKKLIHNKKLAPDSNLPSIPQPKTIGRPRLWTDEDIIEEANFLIEWCKKPDSIVLADCYAIRGYHHDLSFDFSNRSKDYSEAKMFAKSLIGARRERLGLLGELDASIVRSSQANYDREHLETLKLMKTVMQLKAQASTGESLAIQVVSFDSLPEA